MNNVSAVETTGVHGPPPTSSSLVCLRDLHVTFRRSGHLIHAVRGVNLELGRGEVLGLVGESGSGKSVMSSAILGLLPRKPRADVRGEVIVEGIDMVHGSERSHRELRRAKLGAVFQDPMTSLNPTMTIGAQLIESAGTTDEAIRLLEAAEVPEPARRMKSYPHELSGGLRQRVMVAMAIGGNPSLVIADEPTTALDVTVQAQILRLLAKLREEMGLSIMFITHDLAVAAQIADRVAVMHEGKLVEVGATHDTLLAPTHPYTQGLVKSRLTMTMPRNQPIPEFATSTAHSGTAPGSDQSEVGGHAPERPAATPSTITVAELSPAPEPLIPRPPALEVIGITKAFQLGSGRNKSTLQALAGVDLAVDRGESLAIVGESGCGKSTLLRIMAGLLRPDGGEVALMPREQPQVVFQDAGASLTPWLTVEELVGERLSGQRMSRKQRHETVLDTLRLVGAPVDLAGARAAELSGGQRQRVAIARSVIKPPAVLLCDEPTSALDVSLAAMVLNLLSDLRRRLNMSIVFVTHDLAAARMVADRIAVMSKGRVVETGDVDSVCTNPQSEYTRTLLAAMPEFSSAGSKSPAEPQRAAG